MRYLLLVLLVLVSSSCVESEASKKAINLDAEGPKTIHAVFYNVENLFDTKDDPKKLDDDFTPAGKKNWTDNRYDRKISQLAKVILSMESRKSYHPFIIGLAEVENAKVVKDLAKAISSDGVEYKVVHEESNDRRGIDVALMYRSDLVKEIDHEAVRIAFSKRGGNTRDILHFDGELYTGEEFHVFLNHWPSRREGWRESEHKRVSAANTLKDEVDVVLDNDSEAKIIIMGDFNDYPDNKSIHDVLGASETNSTGDELVNLAYKMDQNDMGTYNYKGDWGMLDQAIVSNSFFEGDGMSTTMDGLNIYKEKFMLYYNKKDRESYPSKTYGRKYFGGYSDHLPIVLEIIAK